MDAYYEGVGVYCDGVGVYCEGVDVYYEGLGVYSEGLGVDSEGLGVYSEGLGVYWTLRMSTNIQSTAYSLHIRFSEGQRNCIQKTNLYKDHECTIERLFHIISTLASCTVMT